MVAAAQQQQQPVEQHSSGVRAMPTDSQGQQLQQQVQHQPGSAARPAGAAARAVTLLQRRKRRKCNVQQSSKNAIKDGKLCRDENCKDPETGVRTRMGSR